MVVDAEEKQDREISLIQDFIKKLFSIDKEEIKISPYSEKHNVPDAKVEIKLNGNKHVFGIELVEYFGDAEPGRSSPSKHMGAFFVQFIEQCQILLQDNGYEENEFTAWVTFKDEIALRKTKLIAKELAGKFLVIANNWNQSDEQTKEFSESAIKDYELDNYFSKITIFHNGNNFYRDWQCNNLIGGFVGLNVSDVAKLISHKVNQSHSHNWGSVDEKWLLICATGEGISQTSTFDPSHIDWKHSDIICSYQDSKFDKIYFWDCNAGWIQQI